MPVDPTELLAIATRVKRATGNRDVIELCDFVLGAAAAPPMAAKPVKQAPGPRNEPAGCPECERRRAQRTAAQQRWRSKRA